MILVLKVAAPIRGIIFMPFQQQQRIFIKKFRQINSETFLFYTSRYEFDLSGLNSDTSHTLIYAPDTATSYLGHIMIANTGSSGYCSIHIKTYSSASDTNVCFASTEQDDAAQNDCNILLDDDSPREIRYEVYGNGTCSKGRIYSSGYTDDLVSY